jgi:ATP-dependent RNA helicase DeaD
VRWGPSHPGPGQLLFGSCTPPTPLAIVVHIAAVDAPAGFASLRLREPLLAALSTLGYEEPTPIQRAAIPPLLEGRDLLGQAATGTGKTAAFALPLLERVTRDGTTRALVLVPTRELAIQVAEAIHRYGKALATSVLAVYGGASMVPQMQALARGVTVVVATPGRALDHLRRGTLRLDGIEVVVLDEADEMLDMGFAEDLEALLTATPVTRQTALFSATLPARIVAIAGRHLRDPVRVAIAREALPAGTLPRIRQTAYIVPRAHKPAALGRVLDMESPSSAIVFCRTRTEVDELTEKLNGRGYRADALHGGLSQEQRDRVMKHFRTGSRDLLVATDVAARGLDIEHVSHVVNYDVPAAPEAYVHRIGRTGRAGREGVAITLTEPREHRMLRNIEALTGQRIEVRAVPTIADLRSRRLELTRASLRETILAGGLDDVRVVVESLAAEFDVMDVAAAAVKLAHEAEGASENEPDIPILRPLAGTPPGRAVAKPAGTKPAGWMPGAKPAHEKLAHEKPAHEKPTHEKSAREKPVKEKPIKEKPVKEKPGAKPAPAKPTRPTAARFTAPAPATEKAGRKPAADRKGRPSKWETTRLFIGAGREAGIRPADLVGAITNEAGIESWAIGAIQIGERYSLVEVPEEIATEIMAALRATKIKGRRVTVRRDHEHSA